MFSENSLDDARAARDRQVPMGHSGRAWNMPMLAHFWYLMPRASYITGTELVVDGGLTGKYA